jgi:hypothetical protein
MRHSCWICISQCFKGNAFILKGSGVQPQPLSHNRGTAILSFRIMIFYISNNCKSGVRLGYFNFIYFFNQPTFGENTMVSRLTVLYSHTI